MELFNLQPGEHLTLKLPQGEVSFLIFENQEKFDEGEFEFGLSAPKAVRIEREERLKAQKAAQKWSEKRCPLPKEASELEVSFEETVVVDTPKGAVTLQFLPPNDHNRSTGVYSVGIKAPRHITILRKEINSRFRKQYQQK